MSIFNKLKKSFKKEKAVKPVKEKEVKEEKKPVAEVVPAKKEIKPEKLKEKKPVSSGQAGAKGGKVIKKDTGLASRILKEPHLTERTTDLSEQRKYVFKVITKTNKIEIKKAIEGLYGVEVTKVNIVNIPSKTRQYKRIKGTRPGYKKAVVTLKPGEKIDWEGV